MCLQKLGASKRNKLHIILFFGCYFFKEILCFVIMMVCQSYSVVMNYINSNSVMVDIA